MSFANGQSTSVIELQLSRRGDGSQTSDVVYYIRLTDIRSSNADVIGCPASIGQLSAIEPTLCSEKKHPLTFSFMSPWKKLKFPQNFQWLFRKKQVFQR